MSSTPKGYPTQKKDDLQVAAQFATVQPIEGDKYALDVHANMYIRMVGSDAVEAASTASQINATGHSALVGDVLRITSGALDEERARVIKVETDVIYITPLSAAPAEAVTFDILRHTNPRVNDDGDIQVSVVSNPGPIEYLLNGSETSVEEDTGTPVNSRPLPAKLLNGSGVEVDLSDLASETTLALVEASVLGIETDVASLAAEDFATETTLAALNAKVTAVNTGAVTVTGSALPLGAATEAKQDSVVTSLGTLNNTVSTIAENTTSYYVVDFIDTTPIIDTSSTNIPASASTPLTIVASSSSNIKQVQLIDTTGSFIGLYSDPAGTPVLLGIFGPGSDTILGIDISPGTTLGLRNMENSVISSGIVAINFLGF